MSRGLQGNVVGQTLKGKWTVRDRRPVAISSTGGCFSECFYATDAAGREVFIKFLDIRLAVGVVDALADLQLRLERFSYERDIAIQCAGERLSRVVHAIDQGVFNCTATGDQYPFLIFEKAEGDLRDQIRRSKILSPADSFAILHHVAIAIQQLHGRDIAHQDIKPSNVLNHNVEGHKLGDFGSAHRRNRPRPGPLLRVAGDPTYAPPEHLYAYSEDTWVSRRLMSDIYHLGSLALFLFTGTGATEQLARTLAPEHHWEVWLAGSVTDLMPHLRRATSQIISNVSEEVTGLNSREHESFLSLLRYMLEPDVTLRGHPGARAEKVPYGVSRFVSRFSALSAAARLQARTNGSPV